MTMPGRPETYPEKRAYFQQVHDQAVQIRDAHAIQATKIEGILEFIDDEMRHEQMMAQMQEGQGNGEMPLSPLPGVMDEQEMEPDPDDEQEVALGTEAMPNGNEPVDIQSKAARKNVEVGV